MIERFYSKERDRLADCACHISNEWFWFVSGMFVLSAVRAHPFNCWGSCYFFFVVVVCLFAIIHAQCASHRCSKRANYIQIQNQLETRLHRVCNCTRLFLPLSLCIDSSVNNEDYYRIEIHYRYGSPWSAQNGLLHTVVRFQSNFIETFMLSVLLYIHASEWYFDYGWINVHLRGSFFAPYETLIDSDAENSTFRCFNIIWKCKFFNAIRWKLHQKYRNRNSTQYRENIIVFYQNTYFIRY